jgi:hypothetical protein
MVTARTLTCPTRNKLSHRHQHTKKVKLMQTSRRTLLKQLGFGIAGLGIVQFKTFASPATSFLTFTPPTIPIR